MARKNGGLIRPVDPDTSPENKASASGGTRPWFERFTLSLTVEQHALHKYSGGPRSTPLSTSGVQSRLHECPLPAHKGVRPQKSAAFQRLAMVQTEFRNVEMVV